MSAASFMNSFSSTGPIGVIKVSTSDMLFQKQSESGKTSFMSCLETSKFASRAFDEKCPILEPSAWFSRFALKNGSLTKSGKGDTFYIPSGDVEFLEHGGVEFEHGSIYDAEWGYQLRCNWTEKNVVSLMHLLGRDITYNNGLSSAIRASIPILSKIQFSDDCTFNDDDMVNKEDCIRIYLKSALPAGTPIAGPFLTCSLSVSSISSTVKGRVAGYKILKINNPNAPVPMENFAKPEDQQQQFQQQQQQQQYQQQQQQQQGSFVSSQRTPYNVSNVSMNPPQVPQTFAYNN